MFRSETQRIVAIDARMLGPHGIGAYIADLLHNFALMDHEFRFKVLCPRVDRLEHLPKDKFELIQAKAPIYSLREQWEIYRLTRGVDLLHCPHYNVPYGYRGPLVVTIHDLTHLTYSQFLPNQLAYLYARVMCGYSARRAARIVTDSRFSACVIQEQLGVEPEKIRVIYLALSHRFKQRASNGLRREKMGGSKPYILFVGVLKRHKNVQALLRAFALLPSDLRSSYELVIAGKLDSDYPHLLRLRKELALDDQVLFVGQVSEDDLHSLYAGAALFVLPSLNEGFGLPALEAMAYGVPVIVSNTSSLPEVVGEAGVLADPQSEWDIAHKMEQVLANPSLSQSLAEKGRVRAARFSSKEFASRHLEVYREAVAQS